MAKWTTELLPWLATYRWKWSPDAARAEGEGPPESTLFRPGRKAPDWESAAKLAIWPLAPEDPVSARYTKSMVTNWQADNRTATPRPRVDTRKSWLQLPRR